jgi:branched-chain amino acid transport system ATP-binding protein
VTEPAINMRNIDKRYGSVVAVNDVSLSVEAGSRHAVIGPNGAGKSTLFALVAGTIRPSSGHISLFGEDVSKLTDHRRARRGLAKTFQHSSVFPTMTLLQNVVLAAERKHGRPGRIVGRHSGEVIEVARGALERAGLLQRADATADELSHGERRQLEVALALAQQPRIVLFDEPTAGMSAAETARFVDLVRQMPRDITILIIEHDLDVVFSLADRVSVLHLGALLADGTPAEIKASELVQQTYLGVDDEDSAATFSDVMTP